jgi:MIP family channel proteins
MASQIVRDSPAPTRVHASPRPHRHPLAPYLAEALGTFALVFAGPGAAAVNASSHGGVENVGVGLSFGLIVMSAIFTFGHISGAHINPAVSLAFRVLRRIDNVRLAGYLAAQLTGAALAGLAIYAILGDSVDAAATVPHIGGWDAALVSEVILTFFLVMVVLAVATDDRAQGTFAAIAIGGYVAFAATGWGPVAGASMNPARSFGPAIASGVWDYHWVYWLGPIAGALLAVVAYEVLRPPPLGIIPAKETFDGQSIDAGFADR